MADSRQCGLREAHLARDRARTLMPHTGRHGLQRLRNDRVDMRTLDRPRRTRTRRIEHAIQTMSHEARARLFETVC